MGVLGEGTFVHIISCYPHNNTTELVSPFALVSLGCCGKTLVFLSLQFLGRLSPGLLRLPSLCTHTPLLLQAHGGEISPRSHEATSPLG